MIKTIVMKSLMNGSSLYEVGNYVRVKMFPSNADRPQLYNEYIGRIIDIDFDSIVILNDGFKERLMIVDMDKIRRAEVTENFDNTPNFDKK